MFQRDVEITSRPSLRERSGLRLIRPAGGACSGQGRAYDCMVSIESCMMYVLWAGFRRQSDRRAAIAAGVVATESLIFAANGFRCPLTELAERVGAEHGSVTDIYLPRWFAHNLPAIHVPLIALAGYLHRRNLRQR